jgi:hypothetical protein
MLINLQYDALALGAPQSFRDGVQTAANIIGATFSDAITVNVTVGYGEITGLSLGTSAAEGGPLGTSFISYTSLRSDLARSATSADDFTSLAFLPVGSSLQGVSTFVVSRAQEKTFGLVAGNATANDGRVGFQTSLSGDNLIASALHEITHAMGRFDPGSTLDLFRYGLAGVHSFPISTGAGSTSYFSIDGGHTDLADFDTSSDLADWANLSGDSFNFRLAATTSTALSPVDLAVMDVLGFHRPLVPARAPEMAFDRIYYLSNYSDVAAAQVDAQAHYDSSGWHEGRNPDAFFSTLFYLQRNPDIAKAGIDPLAHYEQFGWKEGRDPSASFSTSHYLAVNADVKLAGLNPLDHYILFGQFEHRAI